MDLLQCRPLQVQKGKSGTVIPPDVPEENILLETSKDVVLEFEQKETLSVIVHVYDVSNRKCKVYNDVANEHLMITC